MKFNKTLLLSIVVPFIYVNQHCCCQCSNNVSVRHNVTLKEAHKGTLEIDTMLLNSYTPAAANVLQFYLDTRSVFKNNKVDFTNTQIVEAAQNNDMHLMGAPMLGNLEPDGVTIWLRSSNKEPIIIKVTKVGSKVDDVFLLNPDIAGKDQRIELNRLSPNSEYRYRVISKGTVLKKGTFATAPRHKDKSEVRIAFGSCFHKIGRSRASPAPRGGCGEIGG